MVRYCQNDVRLLERIYLKLRPYMLTHPNSGVYIDGRVCPKCGSKNTQFRGFAYTNTSKYRRLRCNDCGGWGREKTNVLDNKVTTNA